MAITNHERVGKALDLLRQGLAPYIEREMRVAYESQWSKQAAYSLKREGDLQKALPCNGLVVAWSEVERLAVEEVKVMPARGRFEIQPQSEARMRAKTPRHMTRLRASQALQADERSRQLACKTAAVMLVFIFILQFAKVMMPSPASLSTDPSSMSSFGYTGPLVFEIVLALILWIGDRRAQTWAFRFLIFVGILGTFIYLRNGSVVGAAIEVAIFGGVALVLAGKPNRLRTVLGGAICALGCLGVLISFIVPL